MTGYWEKCTQAALALNPLASVRLRRFDIYRDLVGAYTRRELSYPSDIINAFSSVTSAMKKCGSGPFICGIPERALHVGLPWVLAADRLTCCQIASSTLCPNWSWAGWVGLVEWPGYFSRFLLCSLLFWCLKHEQ